jgi:hypothetical protein
MVESNPQNVALGDPPNLFPVGLLSDCAYSHIVSSGLPHDLCDFARFTPYLAPTAKEIPLSLNATTNCQ